MRGRKSALSGAAHRRRSSYPPTLVSLYQYPVGLVRRAQMVLAVAAGERFTEAARQAGLVTRISVQSVRRILRSHRLAPWRKRIWLSPTVARDARFAACVRRIADLYTRPLSANERVICADEHTSMQPRPRRVATRVARPLQPAQIEHEYLRCGALNLLAALDTRSGKVWGEIAPRKRLKIADFASLEHLSERLRAFIREWNERAHAFHGTHKSFENILAKCEPPMLKAA